MTDPAPAGIDVLGPVETRDTTRSVGAMSALTAVSRATGFLRLTVVTSVLGTTYLANTYETANTVPNVLFELLAAGALQAVLIPTMVGLVDQRDRKEAEHVAGAVLGLTCTVLAVVAAATAVLAPQIMELLFHGVHDPDLRAAEVQLGTFFLWFFLPQVVMYGANVVATAVLNAEHHFALPAFAPTLNNVVVIATYLTFGAMRAGKPITLELSTAEKLVLAGGTTLGVVVFCGVTVIAAGRGFRFRPNLDHRHPVVRRLGKEGLWAAAFLALTQVLLVVLLQISNRREGAVAVYNMAWAVYLLPHALFSVPVLTTRFPILTRQASDSNWVGFGDTLGRGIRSITFLTLPATCLLIALADPGIRLVVHGRASHRVGEIANATIGFAPGIVGFGLFLFFTRAAYAQRDARTPTLVNLVVAVVGAVLMFSISASVAGRELVTGLGASYAAAQILGALLLGVVVLRRLHARGGDLGGLFGPVARNTAAALVAGLVAWAVSRAVPLDGTIGAAVQVTLGGLAGALVFVVLQSLLGGPRPVAAVRSLGTADRVRSGVVRMSSVIELLGPAVGGIRTHVAELTRLRRARGHDTVVAGPMTALGAAGVVDEAVEIPRRRSPQRAIPARRQLAAVLARHDARVVHAHGLKAGWLAISVRPRPQVVLTVHNIVLEPYENVRQRGLAWLERRLLPRVDHAISPSSAIDRRIAGSLPADRRSVIVPVSPQPVPGRSRDEVRSELGISDGTPLVVVAARLHRQKDLPMFLRAFASVATAVPDAQAVLLGDGAMRAQLEDMIGSLGLAGRVRLLGRRDDAIDLIAASDLLALSSIWEAVPLAVVEALQLGVPVVTTRVGIVDELISDGVGGAVVDVGADAAMASAMIELLTDAPARAAAAESGRERVLARLDPDRLVDEVEAVYTSLEERSHA